MANDTKQYAKWIDLPDGQGGTERKWLKDEEAREMIRQLTPASVESSPTAGSDNLVTSGGVYAALQGKQDTISDLAAIRSGAAAGATALQQHQDISGKSDVGHTHTKSDITDFNDGDYAAASHNHTKSQITDFAHTHTKSDITDYDNPEAAFVGETLVFYSGAAFSGETLVLG